MDDFTADSSVCVRTRAAMKEIGWRLFCLLALPVALVLAEETSSNDLKTDNNEIEGSRSGAVLESGESDEKVTKPEVETPKASDYVAEASPDNEPSDTKRFFTENLKENDLALNRLKYISPQGQALRPLSPLEGEQFPDQNYYRYDPANVQNANQILTYNGVPSSEGVSANQVLVSGSGNQGIQSHRSGTGEDEILGDDEESGAYSRVIPYNERIQLHKIPGANNIVTCTREGELYNFWSSAYQCLVCACIRDSGVLRAVCASCAGCMAPPGPSPGIVEYPEVDNTPGRPSLPEVPATIFISPVEEEVTCRPLPSGQPFDNPLHPCQVCICVESINMYGKPDVHIKCEENPQCVLPTDVTVIPSIPDVPVPSPYCDKFPLNVLFPHPSDSCKTCRCSVQLTQHGLSEKQITCLPNPDCTPDTEITITETPEPYPVTPSYPIPVEPQIVQKPVNPEIIPFVETDTPQPSPWTPATVPAPRPGPLPGPSPHDSCRPYVPNTPFQHPWDECQMCVCTEAFAKKHVTVEISCFTKKSCCVEPPFDVITPATLPHVPYKPSGKLKFQDAICEYKTFGVEFTHPRDPCTVCTCELQGRLITPLCKRSSKPECQLVSVYPTLAGVIQENTKLPPSGSFSSYNAGSSSSQNKAIKNAFVSYQNPYGSSGLQSSQLSADQQASSYNQWNLQNYQRPGDLGFKPQISGPSAQLGPQNFQRPGETSLVYGPQNLQRPGNSQFNYGSSYGNIQGLGYPQYTAGQGYQDQGAYGQNYQLGSENNAYPTQVYPGYQSGILRPAEVINQAQTKVSSSASASAASGLQGNFGYGPGYQYPGGTGSGYPVKHGKIRQFAQTSASAQSQAQASSMSSIRYRGRSGNPDDNEPADKEN